MTMGDRLESWAWRLDRRPGLIVVFLAVIYVVLIAPSVHRHLWFDELHTFYIAQASSMRQLMDEIRLLDLNPPMTYVLVRASMKVFGPTELGARLPSIVGYFLGSMALFVFVTRRVGPLWGATGVGLFWSNLFLYLATEARPYAVLLAFFGLALVSWDRVANYAATGWVRRRALAGVAVGLTGMLLSHVFAALWVMSFWAAELMRDWRQRRVDGPLWATLIVPLAACVTYIPLVQNVGQAVAPWWSEGSIEKAHRFYVTIFSQVWPALMAASVGAFAVAIRRGHAGSAKSVSDAIPRTGFQAPELVFLLASLLPPALLNVLAIHKHMPFFERYGFLTVLTAHSLVVLFIAYESRVNRVSGMVAALVILGFSLVFPEGLGPDPASTARSQTAIAKDFNQIHPELPLVANSAITYLQIDHYENLAVLSRLYYLVDPQSSIKYAQSNLTEGLFLLKQYFPIRANVSTYADFVGKNRHFMIFGELGKQQGWLLTKLKIEGAEITELGYLDTPYKDSQLYEVRLDP